MQKSFTTRPAKVPPRQSSASDRIWPVKSDRSEGTNVVSPAARQNYWSLDRFRISCPDLTRFWECRMFNIAHTISLVLSMMKKTLLASIDMKALTSYAPGFGAIFPRKWTRLGRPRQQLAAAASSLVLGSEPLQSLGRNRQSPKLFCLSRLTDRRQSGSEEAARTRQRASSSRTPSNESSVHPGAKRASAVCR